MSQTSHRRQPDWDPRSEAVLSDQAAAYDAMRHRCPVAYSDYLGWSMFRHKDVVRVLDKHDTFDSGADLAADLEKGCEIDLMAQLARPFAVRVQCAISAGPLR